MSNKRYLVILPTAFNPSKRLIASFEKKRIYQYINGLEKIYEISNAYKELDFVLVDNTISPNWQIPGELNKAIEKIPRLKKIFFFDNELPSRNKGCGNIIAWRKVFEEIDISQYEYCIHFEPRQQLLNFSFFKQFIKKLGNYFRIMTYRKKASTKNWAIRCILKLIPLYGQQFHTGLFSLETKLFTKYAFQVDINYFAEKKICLEDDMFKKLRNKNIIRVEKLGLLWHDAFNDVNVEY